LGLALVSPALGRGQFFRIAARPATRFQALAIARDRNTLNPQINADLLLWCDRALGLHLHRKTQPPVPERILCETTALPLHPFQAFPLEHPQALAGKAYAPAFALHTRRLKGDPPERTPRATTHAPLQLQLLGRL